MMEFFIKTPFSKFENADSGIGKYLIPQAEWLCYSPFQSAVDIAQSASANHGKVR
jgi:hypothetical protein